MKATKLNAVHNAQVQVKPLQAMCERGTATSDQCRQLDLECRDWARLPVQGRGPHTAGGHAISGRNRHVPVGSQPEGQGQ